MSTNLDRMITELTLGEFLEAQAEYYFEASLAVDTSPEPEPVGEEFPLFEYGMAYFDQRGISEDDLGPLAREALRSLPSRIVYNDGANSEEELEILEYNRDLIQAEPHWFINIMIGGTRIRECRDIDGQLISDTLVRPLVNQRASTRIRLSRQEMEGEAREWALSKVHTAYIRDSAKDVDATGF